MIIANLSSEIGTSVLLLLPLIVSGFVPQTIVTSRFPKKYVHDHRDYRHTELSLPVIQSSSLVVMGAKKRKKVRSGAGQGFGKSIEKPPKQDDPFSSATDEIESGSDAATTTMASGFSSIENADNDPSSLRKPRVELDIDPSLPPEERTKQILRQRYGLKPLEEQQGDAKAIERKKKTFNLLEQARAMDDEEFDLFAVLPKSVTTGIDLFLKVGLGITTLLFVLAGIGITIEAWGASGLSGAPIPEDLDRFIVTVIEPNFTTCGLVLLGFSISLGIFATAQLGSGASVYQEDP